MKEVKMYSEKLRRYSDTTQAYGLLIAAFLIGIVTLVSGQAPRSFQDQLPFWISATWAILISGGAVLCFVGVKVLKEAVFAWLFELAGSIFLSVGAFIYLFLMLANSPNIAGSVTYILVGMLGVVYAVRAFQLNLAVKKWLEDWKARIEAKNRLEESKRNAAK